MSTSKSPKNAQAYLNFEGRCEEALEFYKTALGAEVVDLMRMQDNPDGGCAEGPAPAGDKIMHSSFRIGAATIMASDCSCTGQAEFKGFSLALEMATEADADKFFAALAEGGTIQMPLAKTFWSPKFGVVADKFGVSWMINVVP